MQHLKPIYEEVSNEVNSKGYITINKNAKSKDKFVSFFKKLGKMINKTAGEDGESNQLQQEKTPPGREKQVKKLKKVLPKTYKDKSGKRKKSSPWAVAAAQASQKKLKEDIDDEDEKEKKKKGEQEPQEPDKPQQNVGNEKINKTITPGSTKKDPLSKSPTTSDAVPTGGEDQEHAPEPETPNEKSQDTSASEIKPGEEPPKPTGEPQMFGDDIEIFKAQYVNVKEANYHLEFRRQNKPDGKIACSIVVWEVEGGVKEGKPGELKFVGDVIYNFPNKEALVRVMKHFRWEITKFLKTLGSE